MNIIELTAVNKKNKSLTYSFSVSEELEQFFSNKDFIIEYPESMEAVPDTIAAIPFVCNVLPIIWLTNSTLVIPELDKAFYECVPEVKQGYQDMYPETELKGALKVGKIIPCEFKAVPQKSALFYSGGVDSMASLYRHLKEKPILLSIWGSDIRFDNEQGWSVLQIALNEAAQVYSLQSVVIRSRFRDFDKENELNKSFSKQLQTEYWYGIKHGLGIISHAAIYAYLYRIETVYIAASNSTTAGIERCASDPRTDNKIRFADCRVVHDACELTRQDKIELIVRSSRDKGTVLPLHVCWEKQSGNNCCMCEKCYRTITGLVVENVDPIDYGFLRVNATLPYMHERMVTMDSLATITWTRLRNDTIKRQKILRKNRYWKDIKWIRRADFLTPGALKMPITWRVRQRISKLKITQAIKAVIRRRRK